MTFLRRRHWKTLAPVSPNAGVEVAYRRAILALLDAMHDSIRKTILPVYRVEMAHDANPDELRRLIARMGAAWQARFDRAAPELAEYFAQAAKDRADGALLAILKKAGFAIGFGFRVTPDVRTILQAAVAENVALIRSIPQQYLLDVQGLVMRSVQTGRALHLVAPELEARYDIGKRRAALISRDQNNKATAMITRQRQIEVGVQARWRHSAAGKEPRPDHVAFAAGRNGGPYYDPKVGALISGERIWPGQLINCRCTSCSVVPGF